jgi:hypothetical protein
MKCIVLNVLYTQCGIKSEKEQKNDKIKTPKFCRLKFHCKSNPSSSLQYNSNKITGNVTTTAYSSGSMSTELKYWGVDSDSNFFCHWVWQDEPEIVMKVPVEVGGEEHRAAFYFICFL